MREIEIKASLNDIQSGNFSTDLLGGLTGKVTITRDATGRNRVIDSDGDKAIDFEGISPKVVALRNVSEEGGGDIDFKVSGAAAQSGSLQPGGVMLIHNGDIDSMSISTSNADYVHYWYSVMG